jgi:hypothetical protein
MKTTSKTEQTVAAALRDQLPVKGLPGVSIQNVQEQPEQPFGISFELLSGPNRIQVLGEIKPAFSPRLLEEISPWIRRLKSLRTDVSVAVIAPLLSSQAQAFCIQNGIDFLDLSGNVFINVPGKFTLQRSGMRARSGSAASENELSMCSLDVFRAFSVSFWSSRNRGPSPRSAANLKQRAPDSKNGFPGKTSISKSARDRFPKQ